MQSTVFYMIQREEERQSKNIELIASENFVSNNVLKALGSCLTNKYSEGYPSERSSGNKGRYYGGCQYVDEIEQYCCDKWKEVFNTDYHVNVQPHSGSQANMAAYASVINPGDTILAMELNNGGHLTHGSKVNFSGKMYNFVFYGVDESGRIDYDDIFKKMIAYSPKLILAGASAYSRSIDFVGIKDMIEFSRSMYGDFEAPLFMVDMSHIAGLVATGLHQSPFGVADIVTTTTHKTLRGPRGGLIFCTKDGGLDKKIDSSVFPGIQGGPIQNIIAAKAIAAEEACTEEFKAYMEQVVSNASAMANRFIDLGYDVVTGGTDNHMFLIDLTKNELTGKEVQDELDKHLITVNKNCVPNEKRSPTQTSGIRIGTPAMTTRGYREKDFCDVADKIDNIIKEMKK